MSAALDYSQNDRRGWCGDPKRGAAMGRNESHADDREAPVKLYLRAIRLNGDYDRNGTYFGWVRGSTLYWVCNSDQSIDFVIRVYDYAGRDAAKAMVRIEYPNARFYR